MNPHHRISTPTHIKQKAQTPHTDMTWKNVLG